MLTEQRQVESKRVYSMLQCLTSPLVLLMAAMYFSNVCLLNGVTFFMPTIVKGFGMTNSQTGLVMAIPSALALIALLWWGRRSDKHQERYGHAAFANLLGGVALLLSMVIHNPVARVSLLSLTFACTLAFTAPFWAIPGSFLTGRAAAGGIATVSAIGVLGGFIAPWIIGAIRDRTGDFRVGFVGVACLAMIVSIVFYLIGRRREREPIG
jgi:nitrate/nitrite transporter NarK